MPYSCYRWSDANISWKSADIKWSECATVPDLCAIWGTTDVQWKNANWLWSRCSGSVEPPIPPVSIVIPRYGVDATTLIPPWQIEPWNPYRTGSLQKTKRIQLVCMIDGQEYTENKEAKPVNVNVSYVRVNVKHGNKIGLDLKLEN